jgi:hypothetical protein
MLHIAEALAATGIDLITEPDLLQHAKTEFATSGPDLPT